VIPDFGLGDVLPPFMGSDITGELKFPRSPYISTMSGLVDRFATSPKRASILRGFCAYRQALRAVGFDDGFQWIDGSFVEACEVVKGRPPSDIDIVTLVHRPANYREAGLWMQFLAQHGGNLLDSQYCKATYLSDAYTIDLDIDADLIVENTAYWFGLFSHQRDTFKWKGLVQIDIASDDNEAMALLAEKEAQW
jgi:hypothetical protein